MRFDFSTPSRVLFGPGICSEVPVLAANLGQRVFLATDSLDRCGTLLDGLLEQGLSVISFIVKEEPDLNVIEMATRKARESDCQLVIGFGGGSTLDTGKSIAAFMTNSGDPSAYLEVIGTGRILYNPPIPYIAIPTTAGTGSEVTRNAVIRVSDQHLKASLRSPYLLPRIAVVDPEQSYSLPPPITAMTGLDALTQLIEPFVCKSPTPLTDALCREAIPRVSRSLRVAFKNPLDPDARQDMALASLFGGMALANARLGAVHGMANPIGGMSHAPHGAICACLLPLVMETNLHALYKRQPNSPSIARYAEVAHLLTSDATSSAEAGAIWVRELCEALEIRSLDKYGVDQEDFPALVEQSQKANSMKGNPVTLTDSELVAVLQNAL
jgi:alcohol dehydrogenase class IV